jgi:hypothetical protein
METTRFCVLYRFRIIPGMEQSFTEGWSRMTRAIREKRGGLGSRLHVSEDGWWVAYAQWPDRAVWVASREDPESPDAEAESLMARAVSDRRPPILLEPKEDLLVSCSARPGGS